MSTTRIFSSTEKKKEQQKTIKQQRKPTLQSSRRHLPHRHGRRCGLPFLVSH
jgi:hypothetical protein